MKTIKKNHRNLKLDTLKTLKFFDFNRNVNKAGVQKLMNSIQEVGIQRGPVIVYTNIITGAYEYYIIDGQHLVKAAISLNIPEMMCFFIMEKIDSKERLVQIISLLNITASTWTYKDFLHAWKTIDMPEYEILNDKLQKFNQFTISDVLKIYSCTGKKDFQKGLLKLGDINKGDIICKDLIEIFPLTGGKSSRFIQGYLNWLDKTSTYDHEQMLCKLRCHKGFFTIGENFSSIAKKLDYIYNS